MEDNNKPQRKNKFAGKEDISRATTDSIITEQIDQLREISRTTDDATAKLRESVAALYDKQIPIDTEKFEHLNRFFIGEMEDKLRKVKRPSKGLIWYIVMWVITLLSSFLAGYLTCERQQLKQDATYWYRQYDGIKKKVSY